MDQVIAAVLTADQTMQPPNADAGVETQIAHLRGQLEEQSLNAHQLREYLIYLEKGLLHTEERSQWFRDSEAALLHKALVCLETDQGEIKG